MAKIAGIKGKSPEAYPPDNPGVPIIHTESLLTEPVEFVNTAPVSLLPDGPVEAGSSGDRIIVMFSGQLQWPFTLVDDAPVADSVIVTVGIYLDGSSTPAYSITAFVPASNVAPATPIQPVPFSLFWETSADGAHEVDIKAEAEGTGGAVVGAWAVSGSLVLISTPV
jgi:hypothetical protein